MKILIPICVLLAITLTANETECKYYLNKSSKAQDEMAMYIVNDLNAEAYLSANEALKYAIKAKVTCQGVQGAENFNFDKKIVELKSYADKYRPKN